MAFGFNGFQIGKELGAGLAKSRDLFPLNNFMLRYGAQQKALHQQMLQYAAREIGSFNPRGVMRPDMPIVMEKYDRWKSLLMEHPEAVMNPRSKWFNEIDDARKDLYATTDSLIDGAKQAAGLTKMISTSELKGHHLSEEGAAKYQYLMQNGVSGFMNKYPGEVNFDEAIIPTIGETAQQIQGELKNAANWGAPEKVLYDDGKGIKSTWDLPKGGYMGIIMKGRERYDALNDHGGAKQFKQSEFNNLATNSPETIDAMQQALKDEFEGVPDAVVPKSVKKAISNLKITDGGSLWMAEQILSNKPEVVSSGVSDEVKLQHMKLSDQLSIERIQQAAAHLGIAEAKLGDTRYKDFLSEVTKRAAPYLKAYLAADEANPNWTTIGANNKVDLSAGQYKQAYETALGDAIKNRSASDQFIPSEFTHTTQESFGKRATDVLNGNSSGSWFNFNDSNNSPESQFSNSIVPNFLTKQSNQ